MTRTALIVGAGIGGLSAAIALRRAGFQVRVFEQAAAPRELGFGVALAPNAIAALRELGVADTVLARGFEPRSAELRRMDGTVVKRAELPKGILGGPMMMALRPALHGALLDTVGVDSISVRSKVTGFSVDRERVMLQLENGETAEGDLLVGADGIWSIVRQRLHPDEPPPRQSGIVALRGAVHDALPYLGDRDAIAYLGPGVESMFLRASESGIYWFVSFSQSLVPNAARDPGGHPAAHVTEVRCHVSRDHLGHRRHEG